MARSRRFAGTAAEHRADASSWAKEARQDAQVARRALRNGDCQKALFMMGLANWRAGMAAGARKWAGGKARGRWLGGSHLGGRMQSLSGTILRACGFDSGFDR